MAFWIDSNCVGCRVCAQKCPTGAITGEAKRLHVISAILCIDCGVCASYCPVEDCIWDAAGCAPAKLKPSARPLAVPHPDLCSGCGDCVDICPEHCLVLAPAADGIFYALARLAHAKNCTGCKECERICSDKRAIQVEWPNGAYCRALGQAPEEFVAPRKAGAAVAR